MESKLISVATELPERFGKGLETPVSRWENKNRKAGHDISVTELSLRPLTMEGIMLCVFHGCLGFVLKKKVCHKAKRYLARVS